MFGYIGVARILSEGALFFTKILMTFCLASPSLTSSYACHLLPQTTSSVICGGAPHQIQPNFCLISTKNAWNPLHPLATPMFGYDCSAEKYISTAVMCWLFWMLLFVAILRILPKTAVSERCCYAQCQLNFIVHFVRFTSRINDDDDDNKYWHR